MNKLYVILSVMVLLVSGLVSAQINLIFQYDSVNGSDTYIEKNTQADTNFGTSITNEWGLSGDATPFFTRHLNNWSAIFESVPLRSLLTNCTISYFMWRVGDQVVDIFPMNDTWSENIVTWNNCGAGGCEGKYNQSWDLTSSRTSLTAGFWFNITLNLTWCQTEYEKDFSDRFGYIIKGDETHKPTTTDARSSDYTITPSQRPIFYLSYIAGSLTEAPTIQPPSPADNTVNNTNVTLNVSHSTTINEVNYYLYFGTSDPLTEDDLYLFNVTRSGDEYSNFTTNVTDGVYFWKWKVQNTTDGLFSINTTQRTWTLDTTNPVITINPSNSFNSTSDSTTNQYAQFLFVNITLTDETELFGFQINITNKGTVYFNFTNESLSPHTTFNYTINLSTDSWPPGVYNIVVEGSDSNTQFEIDDYGISQFLGKITFETPEGNEISISSGGSVLSTNYKKQKDRYNFGFNYILASTTRTFTIKARNKIHYLPDSKTTAHFVIIGEDFNGNWLDFEGLGQDYTVKKNSDFEYEVTFNNLPNTNTISVKSIGGINKVNKTFSWYKGNYSLTAPQTATFGETREFTLNITRNSTLANPNATFFFDSVEFNVTAETFDDFIIFSRNLIIPKPNGTFENVSYNWIVNITQTSGNYIFNLSAEVNVSNSLLDDCSTFSNIVLTFFGKDEETDNNINMTLDVTIFGELSITTNSSFIFRGAINYSICTDKADEFTIDSIMEYGDGTIYTKKKYYLNNLSLQNGTIKDVFLYHLNNSKASEIVFTVFDTTTGDRVSGAFIKILRFYPGENVFRIVEIAKTDEIGQTLGKMVLADVFYKFIIEKPAGTVKLSTDILRILSLTRGFGISFVEDVLATWDKIHGVSFSTTCTKGTKTCRVTWSDSSNIVQSVTLEVWRVTGLVDTLLSSQTTTASAGTISYTVVEDTLANTYEARAFARSTNPSDWNFGRASFFDSDNPFFTDPTHRLASLFPLFLLMVVIIFALIDWGVVGVVVGSLLGMVIGSIVGILPISPFYLISFVLMGVILIFKLSK